MKKWKQVKMYWNFETVFNPSIGIDISNGIGKPLIYTDAKRAVWFLSIHASVMWHK